MELGHKCKATQALFMFEDQPSDDEFEGSREASSKEEENDEAKSGDTTKEVELSLNAMLGILSPPP